MLWILRWTALLVLGSAPFGPGEGQGSGPEAGQGSGQGPAPAQSQVAGDELAGHPFLDLGPPALVREELFELRRGPQNAGPTGGAEGWARLVSSRRPGQWDQVELELGLFAGELVLHQVERRSALAQELVYRERRPAHGRTLRTIWRGDGESAQMERVEWAGRDRLHKRATGPMPSTPLLAAERARLGAPPGAAGPVYWPSADRAEQLRARVQSAPPLLGALGLRLATWHDGRGDLVQWRLFGGADLLAFGFGQGGLVAWRATEEHVGALRTRLASTEKTRQP